MNKHSNTISALNNAAPYIQLYKDKIFVIKIGGELLRSISLARKLLKQIATIHNLGFYRRLVQDARKKIISGNFIEWKEKKVKKMGNRL